MPARQRLQESSLADRQLNGVGRSRHQRVNGFGEVFDTGKETILIEKSMIDGDIEAAIGFCVK